jgi:hypothetical protein
MLRTWVIVGIALAASSGPTLAQDAAAGEQVFKRLCSPCHEIGQDAKIKAHRSTASMAARAAPSRVSTTPQPINLPASPGARKLSPNISARRCKKCRAPAWHLSASRTTRTSQTSGPISSSSGLMGQRNETRRGGKRWKSKRATEPGSAAAPSPQRGLTGLLNPT